MPEPNTFRDEVEIDAKKWLVVTAKSGNRWHSSGTCEGRFVGGASGRTYHESLRRWTELARIKSNN